MPTQLTTLLSKVDACPDIVLQNITQYPANTSHARSNFTSYAKLTLQLPNGMSVEYANGQYPNSIVTPSDNIYIRDISTCLIGRFTALYVALPTPPENEIEDQSPLYYTGDNFYYDGVIYEVTSPGSISLPAEGFTNAELIADYLSQGFIKVIQESEIDDKYKVEYQFFHTCNLLVCLKDKLAKLNCMIVKEPTRTDMCEMKLYEEVLQLNIIYFTLPLLIDAYPQFEESEGNYKIDTMANYVNSICCCKDKNCC